MLRRGILLWFALLGVLSISPLAQAVEIIGRVTNRTTSQPVAGQEVTLLGLRGGMVALDTEDTDRGGRFRFVVAANPNENFLVRVAYRGVNYHQPAVSSGGERIETNVDVFETTGETSGIELESQDFFLEPHPGHVRVVEFIVFDNRTRPPRSYLAERARDSLLLFRTPGGAGDDVSAMIAGPGGMPLRQQPQPGDRPGTYALDYALRPGRTQIEFSYLLPLANNRAEFAQRLRRAKTAPRIITSLEGIRLTGPLLVTAQEEPSRQVRFYMPHLGQGNELRFRVEVDPAVLAGRAPEAAGSMDEVASGEPSVTLVPNPVSESKWYIVGLTLVALALGLYYVYSLSPAGNTPHESNPRTARDRY